MPTLTIAFPAKFQIHARFAMTLIEVVEELKKVQSHWTIRTHYILGKSNLSHARSVLVTEWYEQAAEEDGFFFIDTDHTFTAQDILRVIGLEGDINAGIYCNRARDPTCYPLDGAFTELAENIPLKYVATGFMFFRKSALVRIHEWMKATEGLDRVVISDYPGHIEQRTIPFFHSVMEPPRPDGKRFWLGEDFSFSYRAFEAGLKLRGCVTYTLGHEIPYVVFNDKPRRAPRTWHPQLVIVYAGNRVVSEEDAMAVCQPALSKGRPVIFFCANLQPFAEKLVAVRRYEEFHSHDTFGTLIVYGTEGFQQVANIPPTKALYAYLDRRMESMPTSLLNATNVFVPTYDLMTHYGSLFAKPGQLMKADAKELATKLMLD